MTLLFPLSSGAAAGGYPNPPQPPQGGLNPAAAPQNPPQNFGGYPNPPQPPQGGFTPAAATQNPPQNVGGYPNSPQPPQGGYNPPAAPQNPPQSNDPGGQPTDAPNADNPL